MTPPRAAGDQPPEHPKRIENPTAPRPKAGKKDYDKLVKAAWDARWWCYRRSDGYIVCCPPPGNPEPPGQPNFVLVPSTPSKQGTLDRVTRGLRKRGLAV
jgi:hypothetical protein